MNINLSETTGSGLAFSPYEVRSGNTYELHMNCIKHTDTAWNLSETFEQTYPGFVTKEAIHCDDFDILTYEYVKIEDLDNGYTKVTIQAPWTNSKETTLRVYYTIAQTQSVVAQPAMGLITITESASIKEDWTVELKHEIAALHSVGSYIYDEPSKYSKVIQITGELEDPPDNVDVNYSYWGEHYLDFIEEDGKIIPMSIIEPVYDEDAEYIFDSFTITTPGNTGIFYVDDDIWELNSVGTLSNRINILKNGEAEAIVPLESGLPFLRYETSPKGQHLREIIKIEDQRCSVSTEFYGGLSVGKTIFIMTGNGLYAFDKWDEFVTPAYHWAAITGTDLSYLPDGSIAVANNDKIERYRIKHNFGYIDWVNNRIYTRESSPSIKVNGVSIL